MTTWGRRLRELVLWAGAALGLLAVVVGLAVAFLGFNVLVFRSGSMSPQIPTGGIALSQTVDAAEIAPGDVVSVIAANGERITHRVVSSTLRGNHASLVLKGDANETEDAEIYVVGSVDRVVGSLPYGGYVIVHALTPPGILAVACLSLMLLLLSGGRAEDDRTRTDRGGRHRGRTRLRRRVAAAGAVMLVAGGGMTAAQSTSTSARFTDGGPAGSAGFTTAVLRPATAVTCSTTGGAYIRWTPPTTGPTPTGYRLSYTSSAASGSDDVGAGVTQYRPPGAPGLFTTRDYTVTVTALYAVSWSSSVSTTSDVIRAGGLFGTSYSCP